MNVEEMKELLCTAFAKILLTARAEQTSTEYNVQKAFMYRVVGHLADLGFVCFLPRYCFVCPILLAQVEIRQKGQITSVTMVEATKSEYTKNSRRVDT